MKTALVTGATGFIGGHVVRSLIKSGWRVRTLIRATSSLEGLRDIADQVIFHNIEGYSPAEIFADQPIDALVLLATSYGRGDESTSATVTTNILFPLSLLEQSIHCKVPVVINADTCFQPDYGYLKSYTLSKKQFVQWGRVLCANSSTRFVNMILQHPYGPGDRPGKFIPGIIRDCLERSDEIALTRGEQRKDFVYVADVAQAFLTVLNNFPMLQAGFSELPCGTGQSVSIREFVERIHRLTQSQAQLHFGALSYRDNEIMESVADIAQLCTLGWKPRVELDEGLRSILREDFGRG